MMSVTLRELRRANLAAMAGTRCEHSASQSAFTPSSAPSGESQRASAGEGLMNWLRLFHFHFARRP